MSCSTGGARGRFIEPLQLGAVLLRELHVQLQLSGAYGNEMAVPDTSDEDDFQPTTMSDIRLQIPMEPSGPVSEAERLIWQQVEVRLDCLGPPPALPPPSLPPPSLPVYGMAATRRSHACSIARIAVARRAPTERAAGPVVEPSELA